MHDEGAPRVETQSLLMEPFREAEERPHPEYDEDRIELELMRAESLREAEELGDTVDFYADRVEHNDDMWVAHVFQSSQMNEPGVRWRTETPAAADEVELFKQMTRDAMAARQGQTSFSSLTELWSAIDDWAWDENPSMRYLKNMKSRSMRAVMLASKANPDGSFDGGRPGDEELRQQCAKLIKELPQSSIEKRQIVESTPLEEL